METIDIAIKPSAKQSEASFFALNFKVMQSSNPGLASRLDAYIRSDTPEISLEDASTQIADQMQRNSTNLENFNKPVLIVGLFPGDELIYIFNLSENETALYAKQHIYVCINSLPALYGFMQEFNASEILGSDRVHIFWHENSSIAIKDLSNHPERQHIPTIISGAHTDAVRQAIIPFMRYSQKLAAETKRLQDENNSYYDRMSDEQLADIVAQMIEDRKHMDETNRSPRLMLVTSSHSSVTQYSARDTATAFTKEGWKTHHLNAESSLTPYYMAKQINDYKPDVLLFINHLRTEATGAYPENMMFITWVQDTIPSLNNKANAESWNAIVSKRNRDLIIGYTDQIKPYGYLEERLKPCNMIVNCDIFKPRTLTSEQLEKYGCDIMFASNRSVSAGEMIRNEIVHGLKECGFTESILMTIHDHLWMEYRAERTFTTYKELETELRSLSHFEYIYSSLSDADQDQVIQTLFWRLNDVIYRHVVLEWIDEIASHPDSLISNFKFHLYGFGWDSHPRFAKYAKGELRHGDELSIAYQAAKYCLHLNANETTQHQRLLEIISSVGTPLQRISKQENPHHTPLQIAKRKISGLERKSELSKEETQAWSDWLFGLANDILKDQPSVSDKELESKLRAIARQGIPQNNQAQQIIASENYPTFETSDKLACKLAEKTLENHNLRDNIQSAQHIQHAKRIGESITHFLSHAQVDSSLKPLPHLENVVKFAILQRYPNVSISKLQKAYNNIQHPGFNSAWIMSQKLSPPKINALASNFSPEYLTTNQQLNYAILIAKTDEIETAENIIASAYEQDGNLKDGYARLGWELYLPSKQYDKVLKYCQKDEQSNKLSAAGRLKQAQTLAANGDLEKAESVVAAAYQEDSSLTDGYSNCAWQYYWPKKDHSSITLWLNKDLKEKRFSPRSQIKKAQLIACTEGADKALHLVQDAYKHDIHLMDGYSRIGWSTFAPINAFDRTVSWFKIDQDQDRLSNRAMLDYAVALSAINECANAKKLVKQAYHANSFLTNGFANCSWMKHFLLEFDPERALDGFEEDSRFERLSKQSLVQQAICHAQLGHSEHAEELIKQAYTHNPESKNGFIQIAWHLYISGHCDLNMYFKLCSKDTISNRAAPEHQMHALAIRIQNGDSGSAIAEMKDIYRTHKDITGGYILAALLHYRKYGDTEFALKLIKHDTPLKKVHFAYIHAALLEQNKELSDLTPTVKYAACSSLAEPLTLSLLQRIGYNNQEIIALAPHRFRMRFKEETNLRKKTHITTPLNTKS